MTSSYVGNHYSLTLLKDGCQFITLPYEEVVKRITIKESTSRIIPFPAMIQNKKYTLDCIVDISKFREFLPEKVTDFKFVTYKGTPETQMADSFNPTTKKANFFLSGENELQGIYPMTISSILSVANSSFVYIALRIHTVLIKFLVRDLAILSHSSQISKEYQLHLKQHHHMHSCFWYTPTYVPNCSIEQPRSKDGRYNTVVKTAIDFANKVVACSKNGQDFDEDNVGVAFEHLLTVVSSCFSKKREIHILGSQNSETEKEPPWQTVQPSASELDLLAFFAERR